MHLHAEARVGQAVEHGAALIGSVLFDWQLLERKCPGRQSGRILLGRREGGQQQGELSPRWLHDVSPSVESTIFRRSLAATIYCWPWCGSYSCWRRRRPWRRTI